MPDTLPAFPVDDVTLANVLHSLDGAYTVDDDGTHHLVGADFTLSSLLDFLSGYDETKLIRGGDMGTTPFGEPVEFTEYPDPLYHPNDVIRALAEEILRLRDVHLTIRNVHL